MKTTVTELEQEIETIRRCVTKEDVVKRAAYTLGMIRALRITYTLSARFCDEYEEKVRKTREERLKKIAK